MKGEAPSFAEIGRAVGRTGQAVGAWEDFATAPEGDLDFYDAVAGFFGETVDWLIRGRGEPRDAELWSRWRALRASQTYEDVAALHGLPVEHGRAPRTAHEAKKPAARKAAGGKRKQ